MYNVTASKSSTIGALKSKLCKKLAVGGDAEEGYPDARLRDQYYRNQGTLFVGKGVGDNLAACPLFVCGRGG